MGAEPILGKADLIPDGVLIDSSADALDHAPVAKVVADLAWSVETPANIALFGPWGSGKSSLYSMLKAHLEAADSGVVTLRYDAWKFGGKSLHRNFLVNVADQLKISPDHYLANLHSGTETTRLHLGRFIWRNKTSLFGAVCIALVVATGWVTLAAWAAWAIGSPTKYVHELTRFAPNGAVVFGAVIAGLLLSGQALNSAVEKRTASPLQDADQFSAAFDSLIGYLTQKRRFRHPRATRVVIFIDELDRCSPEDVVSTLIDLKTFLDHPGCVFIVAADREVLETALNLAPQAKPVRDNEPYYSTAGAFLDKIFQHQLTLPPVRPEALTNFARSLADEQDGLWATLRQNERLYEDVVYSLVPAHVRSPRRVKVLMNNFATNIRALESREMDWQSRSLQLAVLTVLETEFPSVVRDLRSQPRLLQTLVNDDVPASDELKRLKDFYTVGGGSAGTSAAGSLLAEGSDTDLARARDQLNAQLDAYLTKVNAARIPLPTLDLIYLQTAGHAEGLSDADLAEALDFAADTDPAQLTAKFGAANPADKQAAVRFLATQANTTVGPGRANVIESACCIAETLDLKDLRPIAGYVASTIFGEVPKGRWRLAATAGALLLGLLEETISDPVGLVLNHVDANQLAADGLLERVFPVLTALDDDRAEGLHELLGQVYETYPEPMHKALSSLPAHQADRLWLSQHEQIQAGILNVDVAEALRRASTSASPPPEELTGLARYRELVLQLAGRQSVATEATVGAIQVGLDPDVPAALYELARDQINSFEIPRDRLNQLAITAIANGPESLLIGEARDLFRWVDLVDTSPPLAEATADGAAGRIVQFVEATESDRRRLAPALAKLIAFGPDSEQLAELISAQLKGLPMLSLADSVPDPSDLAAQEFRRAYYSMLDLLTDPAGMAAAESVREQDLRNAIDSTTLDQRALHGALPYVRGLSTTSAANLDRYLADGADSAADQVGRLRLRIAARGRAGMQPLPAARLLAVLDDGVDSTTMVEAWLETNPPLAQVLRVVPKASVAPSGLGRYVSHRSVTDRSKVWIALCEASYSDHHLAAVGRYGVNDTVVEHCRPRIERADLSSQKKAVQTLLTADLSIDPSARRTATNLALTLLVSGLGGAGPSAARIILNAKGAAPGLKPEVKRALDQYVEKHPRTIGKGDLRQLNDLNLLTKRKRSPLAPLLDWLR